MEEHKSETPEQVKFETLQVYEGAKFKTLYTRKHQERKAWVPDNPALATSFIPGTIRKIFVKEGDLVKKGEKLVILEAMKMLNEIVAEAPGVVKSIPVKIGQIVTKNSVLVELEIREEQPKARKKKK